VHDFTHIYEEDILDPRSDIRETPGNFYIDIELPGASLGPDVSLQWTNSRTLLVQAQLRHSEINEVAPSEPVQQVNASKPATDTSQATAGTPQEAENSSKTFPDAATAKKEDTPVHFIVKERRVGKFARAFHFYVEVDNANLSAAMSSGLMSIVLPKAPSEQAKAKNVKIKLRERQSSPTPVV
jgi:HSP20 family molecular chaperone IbpA